MRIQPPKTDKKEFTKEEFKKYMFDHVVVGADKPIPVLDFFNETAKGFPSKKEALESFLTMWPYQYQFAVEDIFWEMGLVE